MIVVNPKFLFLAVLIVFVSCNSDNKQASGLSTNGDIELASNDDTTQSPSIENSNGSNLSGSVITMTIKNYGMNKGKTVWVNAKNITNTTHIRLDGVLLESTAVVKKGVVMAQLPESFSGKKKVDLELVDIASNNTSDKKKGLLNVDEIYLLKLDK